MIGARLRRLRTARGLTQRQLGEPRYTHAYVSTIESGRRRPSREALEFFAAKLGVEPEELATGRPPNLAATLELKLHEARIALSDGRSEEAERTFLAVAKEARRYRLPRLEARAQEGLGLRLERGGDPEAGLERYRRAEELLTGEPLTARVDAVDGKARCFAALGDLRYAIHLLESLLAELGRAGLRDPDALARIYAGLTYSYLDAGLYTKAAECAAELAYLAPKLRDPARVAQMHMNVARLHLVQGDGEDAIRSLQRAEDAYRQLGMQTEMGGAYLARGYVLSREGRLEEAREQLEQALAIFEVTANEKDLVRALNELARVERLSGRTGAAHALLERSIAATADRDEPIAAWAHRELGLTLADDDPGAAEKHLRTALELFERVEQAVDVAVTYRALGDLLDARGDRVAASEAYRTGILALEPTL